MTHRTPDDNTRQPYDVRELSERGDEPEQPAWQFYVTLLVALAALVAFAMFVYGFYIVRSR